MMIDTRGRLPFSIGLLIMKAQLLEITPSSTQIPIHVGILSTASEARQPAAKTVMVPFRPQAGWSAVAIVLALLYGFFPTSIRTICRTASLPPKLADADPLYSSC